MKKKKVSDQSVKKATGKKWGQWFAFIDQHNGEDLTHKEIVAILKAHSDLTSWWQQMVTVEYEIARGKRKPHEMPDGYQIGKSKTISATIEMAYQVWIDTETRKKWLDDADFGIRKANENKSLRITWVDGQTHLDIYFYPKKNKTQVTINHRKLADSAHVEKMKIYWQKQLEQLSEYLSGITSNQN